MGIFYFDIAALTIHLLNLLLLVYKRYLYTTQVRIFFALILVSMSAALIDVIGITLFMNRPTEAKSLVFVLNSIFYPLQNTIPPVFVAFVLAVSGRLFRLSHRTLVALAVPWAFSILLIAMNPITHLVFSFDAGGQYIRGPGLRILYAIAFSYAAFGIASIVHDRARLDKDTLLATALFIPASLLPAIVQFFIPDFLIQNLGIALSELFILLTIFDFSAYIDRKSGLFNREGLISQLKLLRRGGRAVHVFILQIDSIEFTRFALDRSRNDSLDRTVKKRLIGSIKPDHFGAALGTNQFALAVSNKSQDTLEHERSRLLEQLQAPWLIQNQLLRISGHICEIAIPDDSDDLQILFQAQVSLHQRGKTLAGDRILKPSDLSLENTERRLEISQIIRSSFATGQFSVYFQPLIDAATSRIVSAEALIRLHDSHLGWISPAEFIPIAEQDGSIHQLGDYVMDKSCAFFAELQSAGCPLDYIDVNLSSLQCLQGDILSRMLTAVERHGLQPANIQLEVTETAAAASPLVMKTNLKRLSDAGFPIAIDDFGTGHSNLYTMMGIPFTTVKLDRSLIQSMNETIHGRVGVESIIAMFRKMEIPLVAEGVETAPELQLLQQLRVDLIQGYYFSRPLPPTGFMEYMQSGGVPCM